MAQWVLADDFHGGKTAVKAIAKASESKMAARFQALSDATTEWWAAMCANGCEQLASATHSHIDHLSAAPPGRVGVCTQIGKHLSRLMLICKHEQVARTHGYAWHMWRSLMRYWIHTLAIQQPDWKLPEHEVRSLFHTVERSEDHPEADAIFVSASQLLHSAAFHCAHPVGMSTYVHGIVQDRLSSGLDAIADKFGAELPADFGLGGDGDCEQIDECWR